MQFPDGFLKSIAGLPGFNENAFVQSHNEPGVTSLRLNPNKKIAQEHIFPKIDKSPVPWSDSGFYLSERPSFTFDPLFHAGAYYVQEAGSMFLEHILKTCLPLQDEPLRVLDLCASPGGKTTLLQSVLPTNALLVANEVIRSRVATLRDNVVKWGAANVIVTSNDAKDIARLENFFDIILVDAPCSGSGLFRKTAAARDEWSESNVALCAARQQRILADIWPALRKNGILIYATCSFSKEEDEDSMDFLCSTLGAQSVNVPIDEDWNIEEVKTKTGSYGYRFWPHCLKGEGFFAGVVKKNDGGMFAQKVQKDKSIVQKHGEINKILQQWIHAPTMSLFKGDQYFYILPQQVLAYLAIIKKNLYIAYYGTELGEEVHGKFIPSHALAMSPLIAGGVSAIELDYGTAIAYLQRKTLFPIEDRKGWTLVKYYLPLGWINVLTGRINNYYPKELRILKDKP